MLPRPLFWVEEKQEILRDKNQMAFFKGHLEHWANVTLLADGFAHTVAGDSPSMVNRIQGNMNLDLSASSLLIGVWPEPMTCAVTLEGKLPSLSFVLCGTVVATGFAVCLSSCPCCSATASNQLHLFYIIIVINYYYYFVFRICS